MKTAQQSILLFIFILLPVWLIGIIYLSASDWTAFKFVNNITSSAFISADEVNSFNENAKSVRQIVFFISLGLSQSILLVSAIKRGNDLDIAHPKK